MGKICLFTGITGTLGRAFIEHSAFDGRIRGLSRDEQKQERIREAAPPEVVAPGGSLQLILGDIRDLEKCRMVMREVDFVIHAAALKIIPNAAYNPDEVVRTNILGTENIFRAAIEAGVRKVMFVSSDKAVEPTNLYGATKMVAESLAIEMNGWSETTKISCVRYGNVVGSRGSFTHRLGGERLKVTDPNCTRFWITQQGAISWIDYCMDQMEGGEIFVPRLPSKSVKELIPEGTLYEVVGLRKTEKLHESLIGTHEVRHTDLLGDVGFVIRPWPHSGDLEEIGPYRSNRDGDDYGGAVNERGRSPNRIQEHVEALSWEARSGDRPDDDVAASLRQGEEGGMADDSPSTGS